MPKPLVKINKTQRIFDLFLSPFKVINVSKKLYCELINLRQELLPKLEFFQILKDINMDSIATKLITTERAELNFRKVNEFEAKRII